MRIEVLPIFLMFQVVVSLKHNGKFGIGLVFFFLFDRHFIIAALVPWAMACNLIFLQVQNNMQVTAEVSIAESHLILTCLKLIYILSFVLEIRKPYFFRFYKIM